MIFYTNILQFFHFSLVYDGLNENLCHQKKVLALVLAFACAFTMFAGAASFTDEADISENNRDAVELLTTLKIIKGYEDGSFDPEGTVDRAEMAKMIYTIRNGGNDDASAHVGNTTSFTDISGHWAEGYIKYLQNTGIVAGKSATQFAPDAQVTTAEAMKMALALAGYDEKNAGLTGIDWQKNTLTYATTIGLTDDVNSAMSAGCSRQDAAQILANVLEANAVRYSSIVENFVNDSKTGLSYGGDPITVGYKWMDLTVYVGRMVSSGELNIAGADDAGKDRFSIVVDTVNNIDATDWSWNDFRDEWVARTRTLTLKDGQDHTDLVGLEVKVLTGDKIDEVFGVYATGTSNVVETTMDQVDFDTDGLKIDDVVYDCEFDYDANRNLATAVYADNEAAQSVYEVFTVNDDDVQKVADRVKMIDWDDNGDYETILVNTVNVAKVTSVTSNSIALGPVGHRDEANNLRNNASLDFDDNTIYEDVAKNDYAIVTRNTYNNDWIVEKAEAVSGTVNGKVDNERRVRVDGNWYTLANTGVGADLDNDTDLLTIQDSRSYFENGDQITLYTVGSIAYYAESTTGNDANRAVLMVYDSYMNGNSWNGTPQAKVILADGSKLTVDVDKINGNAPDGDPNEVIDNLTPGALYYYTVNNDGEYSFMTPDSDNTGYKTVDTNTAGVVGNKVDGTTIADEAIVFAYIADDKDAEVYTGRTVKDADLPDHWGDTMNGVYMADTENGFNYVRMFNVEIDSEDTLDTTTDYGYLTTDAVRTRIDGVWYMEYEFWNGEENVTALERTDNDRRANMKKHAIFSFANDGTNDDGTIMIKDVKPQVAEYAAITGANSSSVQLLSEYDGMIAPDVTNSTIIFYVNSDARQEDIGVTDKEGYDFVVGEIDDNNAAIRTYPINAAYILNNDEDEVKLLVIDVDNQLTNKGTVNTGRAGSTTIEIGEAATSDELIAAIEDAAGLSKIVIKGIRTIDAGDELNVPAGLEVIFEDELKLMGTVNGDITVGTINGDSDGTINGTLTITGDTADSSLDDLKGEEGAEIVLRDAMTVGAGFYSNGYAITNVPANTTFTWSANADKNGAAGWTTDKIGGEHTIPRTADTAALKAAFAQYDTVTVTGAVTIDANLTIAEGQTLIAKDALTINDSFDLTVDGDLTVAKTLTVGSSSGSATLNGNGNVTAANVNATGTSNEVAASLNVTLTDGSGSYLNNWVAAAADGAKITLNKPIADINSNQPMYYGANAASAVAVPAGETVPAGTYAKNGSGWLLNENVASITFATAIDNATLQAAFANTNSVVINSSAPSASVQVPVGEKLTLNIAPSKNVIVSGELVLDAVTLDLTKIMGTAGAKVSFSTTAAVDSTNFGSFYTADGTAVADDLQLQGSEFVYGNVPNSTPVANGFIYSGMAE